MFAQSQNQRVILSGSEVLRTKQSVESKTSACRGIYEGVLRNLFSTRNVLYLCKKLLIKRKSQKLVYRFLRVLKTRLVFLISRCFTHKTSLPFRMTYRCDVRANNVLDKSKFELRTANGSPYELVRTGCEKLGFIGQLRLFAPKPPSEREVSPKVTEGACEIIENISSYHEW